MAVYSIKDLEKLSGIKAHTIRMWEQRYKLLKPNRTNTNIRYYLDEDLRFLLNVALLKKNGIRISKIAAMPKEEISHKVKELAETDAGYDTQVDALTIAMIELDEYKFDRITSANTRLHGFEHTMLHIIHPFLNKLGLLWLTGSVSPVQENFISHLIRRKIMAAIDGINLPQSETAPKFVIYLPGDSTHELSLMFMHYLLRKRSVRVIYLGTGITPSDLQTVCNIHCPNYVFGMMMESPKGQSVHEYISSLSKLLPQNQLLFSGCPPSQLSGSLPTNAQLLPSLQDVLQFLDSL